jgi:hypothetical protein
MNTGCGQNEEFLSLNLGYKCCYDTVLFTPSQIMLFGAVGGHAYLFGG